MRAWLERCSPKTREKIITLEAELRRCEEQIQELDNLIEASEFGECLLSLDED